MRISVFGLGYVGCVTAACLAKSGHQVLGVDISPEKVVMVNDAVPPVVEPGTGLFAWAGAAWRRLLASLRSYYRTILRTYLPQPFPGAARVSADGL